MRLTPELEPERELAWVQTAEKADLSMDAWAIRALDEAAQRVAAPRTS
jgi:hypothetical protein